MLMLLSPAKTLELDTPIEPAVERAATRPRLMAEAEQLMQRLRELDEAQLQAAMGLSPALAALNAARHRQWRPQATRGASRPAVLSFAGEVYRGLQAASWTAAQHRQAQRQLRIVSGLYGLLRPLDRIWPHRLEMVTRLANARGPDLYAFWGERLGLQLRQDLRGHAAKVVVNLASQAYARAVDRAALGVPVIECVFQEGEGDEARIVGVMAKRARGLMARHLVLTGADHADALDDFADEGYRFVPAPSSASRRVFRRRVAPAAIARGALSAAARDAA